jgi:hypothetical protein
MDPRIRRGHPLARIVADTAPVRSPVGPPPIIAAGIVENYLSIENSPSRKADSAKIDEIAASLPVGILSSSRPSFRRGGLHCAPQHRPLSSTSGPTRRQTA